MSSRTAAPYNEQATGGRLIDRVAPRQTPPTLLDALRNAWSAVPAETRLHFVAQVLTAEEWQTVTTLREAPTD
jgi:hypothetical protein